MIAFDDFRANPREFLWNTPTTIHGGTNYGTMPFYAATGDINVAHDTCAFKGYRSTPADAGPVTAWNVPMIGPTEMADRTDLTHLHIPDTLTPFVMTGGLTGCCVAIAKISNTELRIAHVSPNGTWEDGSDRGSGETLEETMRAGITMNGDAATVFCGVSNYRRGGLSGTLIGVVVNGAWQVWIQSYAGSFAWTREVKYLSRLI